MSITYGTASNTGPYIEGLALQGELGLLLAMHRKALYDCQNGAWFVQLEAAHWLLYTMPKLVGRATGRDPAYLGMQALGLVPCHLLQRVRRLKPLDLEALARLVRTDGADVMAYAYAMPQRSAGAVCTTCAGQTAHNHKPTKQEIFLWQS